MQSIDATELRALLDWPSVVTALEAMFRSGCEMPVRHHHTVKVPGSDDATLLLMPAWLSGEVMGVKLVDIFPGNGALNLPAVNAVYLLFSAKTGEALCTLDGGELTARRTAAASVLAARYLARPDLTRISIIGTGRMAENLARAYGATYPKASIAIWGRDANKASALAAKLAEDKIAAAPASDLRAAIGEADIVSSATLSREPLVKGAWLKPGAHVDLIGGFTPAMREADDDAIRRASVFVDTRAGATSEAGDIVVPIKAGVLAKDGVRADLHELTRGQHKGRASRDEITLFKSVGAALEDLAAAALAYGRRAMR